MVATAGMRKHFSSAGRLRGDGVTETLTTITTTDPAALYQLLTSQVKMVNTKWLILRSSAGEVFSETGLAPS